MEAELFVRLLYNGRVVRPSFCERDECPLRSFEKHIMEFLMPENLGVRETRKTRLQARDARVLLGVCFFFHDPARPAAVARLSEAVKLVCSQAHARGKPCSV